VEAEARLVVELDERGRTVQSELFAESPLLMRVTDSGPCRLTVHLVGGAAGPLGGDRLTTTVNAGDGTNLQVRSVAASLAQPGPAGGRSRADVSVAVGAGATLDWHPQPLVSVAGSDHVQRTTVAIADRSASVCWVDEVVLGRHDEPGGRLTLHQRFTVAGRPILQHTVSLDPDSAGIGRHGRARVLVSILSGGPNRAGVEIETPAMVRPSVPSRLVPAR